VNLHTQFLIGGELTEETLHSLLSRWQLKQVLLHTVNVCRSERLHSLLGAAYCGSGSVIKLVAGEKCQTAVFQMSVGVPVDGVRCEKPPLTAGPARVRGSLLMDNGVNGHYDLALTAELTGSAAVAGWRERALTDGYDPVVFESVVTVHIAGVVAGVGAVDV